MYNYELKDTRMGLTTFYLDAHGELGRSLTIDQIETASRSGEGLLWVDISEVSEDDRGLLEDTFGFHPLSVNACVNDEVHAATVQDFGQVLFTMLHGIDYSSESELVAVTEMGLHIGQNFVVSSHRQNLFSVAGLIRTLENGDYRLLQQGPDFLGHAIMDALVSNIRPTIEAMADHADSIEEIIFKNPDPTALAAILRLKRSIIRLRRVLDPQEETMAKLTQNQFNQITPEASLAYLNLHQRVATLLGIVNALRERSDTILAIYLSALSHQQNQTMRTLSIVAIIFMPLTLLAGIYGMNFQNMPELKIRWAYYVVLGSMGAVAAITIWWFWIRHWIGVGRRRVGRFMPHVDRERLMSYAIHFGERKRS
ncbi:MAG: magnesium transporter CorA family protein [SAR202 cluster bacterium]|nr:magnesium transporter CorA family protein [SAR202 cluster bacterium]